VSYRIGIDTGGTFTDMVLIDEQTGARQTVKVPSTRSRPSQAVFEALERAECDPAEVAFFVLGTTIATNCLLERKGQRTLYLTTEGFEDIPFIQRVDRQSLYDLQWLKPRPYVDRRDCLGVRERVAHDGSVRIALEDAEIERVVAAVAARDAESPDGVAVAVNLLFAYVDASHERRLAEALATALPHVPVSVSSEIAPIWREYERGNTVIVDAYLRRLTETFAAEIDEGLERIGLHAPRFLLKSNGGQIPTGAPSHRAVNLVLSGLAGGLIGARHFAEALGERNIITLDMGGTSADVGVIVDGTIRSSASCELEWGLPIAVPVVDLSTIGAGGSSIASFDQGGFLKVGPESAGAEPGPAAYGRGGTQATVTDANLVTGRLNPDYFVGGELPLDPERARAAVGAVAERLGGTAEEAADAIIDVACNNMTNAIRLLCAERGLDYRALRLMAFGGAGPLHAAFLARSLGVADVVIPPNPGLVSAFGAQAADLRVDRRLTRPGRSDLVGDAELRAGVEQVAREALAELRAEGARREPTLMLSVSCRYLGQNFEQEVPVPTDVPEALVEELVERFHRVHEHMYGYRLAGTVVEFIHLNATALETRSVPSLSVPMGDDDAEPVDVRPVYLKRAGWVEAPVYRRAALGPAQVIAGPAIVEEVDSTTLVLDDQQLRVDPSGSLLMGARVAGEVPA
jgi:N-methylhydantoinase A